MKILLFLFLVIVLFLVYVRFLENSSVFFPTRVIQATPHQIGLVYEDIFFKTSDHLTLHGWMVTHPKARGTLLFLHGNAGNISDRLEKISLFHEFDLNVFIFDYRGYGKSEGKPSEGGLYRDTSAAYDLLTKREQVFPEKIIAYGASLGGVLAIDLASQKPLAGLILDSTFSTAADMAKSMFPGIPVFVLRTKMDSLKKVKHVVVPKLFIHSPEDEVVPIQLGKKLFAAAGNPKEFLEISGTHNEGYRNSQPLFAEKIKSFIDKVLE